MADLSWMEGLDLHESFTAQGLVPQPVQYELFEEAEAAVENMSAFFSG
jgi:hypothetical protein